MDSVRIEADEQLTLPDVDNVTGLQALFADGLALALGGLFGNANGCLSPFYLSGGSFTDDGGGTYYCAFPAFQFLLSVPGVAIGDSFVSWKSYVCTHNPAQGSQVSSIDYTLCRAAAKQNPLAPAADVDHVAPAYPFLYARPVQVAMDTAARKKWLSGARAAVALKTRTRERIEFKFSAARPTAATSQGWACIGKVRHWPNPTTDNPGLPDIMPVTWLDSPEKYANAEQAGDWAAGPGQGQSDNQSLQQGVGLWPLVTVPELVTDPPGYALVTGSKSRDVGLSQVLSLIFSRLQRHLAVDKSSPWYADPVADFKTLLATQADQTITLAGVVTYNGDTTYTYVSSGLPVGWVITMTKMGVGIVALQITTTAINANLLSFVAIPIWIATELMHTQVEITNDGTTLNIGTAYLFNGAVLTDSSFSFCFVLHKA